MDLTLPQNTWDEDVLPLEISVSGMKSSLMKPLGGDTSLFQRYYSWEFWGHLCLMPIWRAHSASCALFTFRVCEGWVLWTSHIVSHGNRNAMWAVQCPGKQLQLFCFWTGNQIQLIYGDGVGEASKGWDLDKQWPPLGFLRANTFTIFSSELEGRAVFMRKLTPNYICSSSHPNW